MGAVDRRGEVPADGSVYAQVFPLGSRGGRLQASARLDQLVLKLRNRGRQFGRPLFGIRGIVVAIAQKDAFLGRGECDFQQFHPLAGMVEDQWCKLRLHGDSPGQFGDERQELAVCSFRQIAPFQPRQPKARMFQFRAQLLEPRRAECRRPVAQALLQGAGAFQISLDAGDLHLEESLFHPQVVQPLSLIQI